MKRTKELIGLVPAAGYGTRLPSLVSSKEVYPIKKNEVDSRVSASYLLEGYREAGVTQSYIIIRKGKWDIPEYLGDGSSVGLNLSFVVTDGTEGVPQSLDIAYPFFRRAKVLLGFPDTLFRPTNVFSELLKKQKSTKADIVLGLFQAGDPTHVDMVELNNNGSIKNIIVKPERSSLKYLWAMAVWTPAFSDFLHEYLKSFKQKKNNKSSVDIVRKELSIGDVIQAAINEKMPTSSVIFDQGSFLDIGTPRGLANIEAFLKSS